LVDNEDIWAKYFKKTTCSLKPKLVLFNGAVKLPVEMPHLLHFYCPEIKKSVHGFSF
jgi:predicted metalloprotease